VLFLLGCVLAFVPLFGLLGYEFSVAVGLTASFAGAWLGARVSNFGRALAQAELMLVPPLVVITLNALRVRNCDYWAGLGLYLLLPGISALCGVATGFVTKRVLWAWGIILLSILWGVVRFYRAPAIFGYDPYVGYFAGTIYDEDVGLPAAFWWARTMHVALALGAVLWVTERRVAGAVLLLAGVLIFGWRGSLGIAPDATDVARALGGEKKTEHFTIVYARGSDTEKQIDLVARDHEFRYAQLKREIGVEPGHVTSFIFPSAADKKKWMGAGRTFIAKPWRKEVYLQHEGFPHPVLKHELAHVFAGEFGDGVFHISMKWAPPKINVGLIEGVAVALDWRGGRELSAAGYARALSDLKMSPPLPSVFGVGFLGFSGPRAYSVAGAFCHYLLETYGPDKLRALYKSAGDFAGVYGKTLAELESEWRKALEQVTLTDEERELVREQMHAPGIWHKVCAHTLAALRMKADELRGRGDFADAEKCLDRIAKDDPDEPQNLVAIAELRQAAGDFDGALAMVDRARAHPKASAALQAHLDDLAGDLAWRAGHPDDARKHWQAAAEAPGDEAQKRTLHAKLIATGDARLREPLSRFFLGVPPKWQRDPALDLWFAAQAQQAAPELGLPVYLGGRGLFLRDAFADSLAPLAKARELGLPDAAFVRENLRIAGLAAYRAGDWDRAAKDFTELLAQKDVPEGTRIEAADWLDRLRFEGHLTTPANSGTLRAP
jgi:tetratricopeptide (TPR) repeat protein